MNNKTNQGANQKKGRLVGWLVGMYVGTYVFGKKFQLGASHFVSLFLDSSKPRQAATGSYGEHKNAASFLKSQSSLIRNHQLGTQLFYACYIIIIITIIISLLL